MWGALISSGQSSGGGSDYPFTGAVAKSRHWNVNGLTVIPEGALTVTIVHRGMNNATIKHGSGPDEILGPGLTHTFTAQQDTTTKKMQFCQQITLTPTGGDLIELTVSYTADSSVNPNSI